MLAFVYGTLKKGHWNCHVMGSSKFVSEGSLKGYKLYDAGFPVLRKSENEEDIVSGEIWNVSDPRDLQSMDRLEGYRPGEHSMYERHPVTLMDGQAVETYIGAEDHWKFSNMEEITPENGVYTFRR